MVEVVVVGMSTEEMEHINLRLERLGIETRLVRPRLEIVRPQVTEGVLNAVTRENREALAKLRGEK